MTSESVSQQNGDLWPAVLSELKLQMTEATFDAWLRNTIGTVAGDQLTVAVKNGYAKLGIVFRVDGETSPPILTPAPPSTGLEEEEEEISELDRDLPADCRFLVELVNFDLTTTGFVMTSNYAWQYWQPYLAMIEKEHGAHTRVTFNLWNTLRSFPAAWTTRQQPEWPSVEMLTSMLVCGREKITGRAARSNRSEVIGALDILETEHIVWVVIRGSGRDRIYAFRVRDNLPLLTPVQISKLDSRLQERHMRELARCKLDYGEWEQLTLSSLLED